MTTLGILRCGDHPGSSGPNLIAGPYRRQAKGSEPGKKDVRTEAEVRGEKRHCTPGFEDRKGPRAKGCAWPPRLEKAGRAPRKSAALLPQLGLPIPEPQDKKSCVAEAPPTWWQFVTAATGSYYDGLAGGNAQPRNPIRTSYMWAVHNGNAGPPAQKLLRISKYNRRAFNQALLGVGPSANMQEAHPRGWS